MAADDGSPGPPSRSGLITVGALTVRAIIRVKFAAFLAAFFPHRHKNSPMGMEYVNVVAV